MKCFFAVAVACVCLLLVGCSPEGSSCFSRGCTSCKTEPACVAPATSDDDAPSDDVAGSVVEEVAVSVADEPATVAEVAEEKAWMPLFDGESTAGWSIPVYGGDGAVDVQEGNLVLGRGDMMTGIRYEKEFPKINYEIQYEARRTEGYDFFAACTFPVNDSFCTFVNGGWSGGVIGLSSINGYDASENPTTDYYEFKSEIWYRFRISVTNDQIQVWITPQDKEGNWGEEKRCVNVELDEETELSTRMEANLYKPLGFCTYATVGQLRNIVYRSH